MKLANLGGAHCAAAAGAAAVMTHLRAGAATMRMRAHAQAIVPVFLFKSMCLFVLCSARLPVTS